MRCPKLHVGGIGRIADVEWIVEQHGRQVTLAQFADYPLQAPLAQAREIRCGQAEGVNAAPSRFVVRTKCKGIDSLGIEPHESPGLAESVLLSISIFNFY